MKFYYAILTFILYLICIPVQLRSQSLLDDIDLLLELEKLRGLEKSAKKVTARLKASSYSPLEASNQFKEVKEFEKDILKCYGIYLQNYESVVNYDTQNGNCDDDCLHLVTNIKSIKNLRVLDASTAHSTGLFNAGLVADGLAKFIVSRTKQELSISFFRKFKEGLNKSDELTKLFSKSVTLLELIGSESFRYAAYLETLRSAFYQDIKNFPSSLVKVLEQQTIKDEKVRLTQDALVVVQQLVNGFKPKVIIGYMSGSTAYIGQDAALTDLHLAFKVLDVVSTIIWNEGGKDGWLRLSELEEILKDDSRTRKLWEIVDAKLKNYPAIDTDKYKKLIKNKQSLLAFATKTDRFYQYITTIKNQPLGQGIDYRLYAETLNVFLEIVDHASIYINAGSARDLRFILEVSNVIVDLALSIEDRHYAVAVGYAVDLFRKMSVVNQGFLDDFLKYGTFAATIAQAENSDQVAAAIEAIALPVGSAAIKRNSKFNVALNTYGGIAIGNEHLYKTIDFADQDKFFMSAHAPLGLAISMGNVICGTSLSLYLTGMDVGAVTAFRLSDDFASELPELTWDNLLAPGAFLEFGLGKTPLSIGGGAQLGPQIRKLNTDTNTGNIISDTSGGWKWFFNVSFDIPVIDLHTSPLGVKSKN